MAAASQVLLDKTPRSGSGSTIGQFMAALAAVTVVAGALGAVFAPRPAPTLPEQTKKSAPAGSSSIRPASNIFNLPPIITNLANPKDTWVRLETSMIFDSHVIKNPEVLGGEIAGDLLAYLHTVTLTQIQGSVGLQDLRQDINERASIRSNGKIKELIIRTLVVQ